MVKLYKVEAVERKGESGATTALPPEAGEECGGTRGVRGGHMQSTQVTATLSARLGILTQEYRQWGVSLAMEP